DVSLAIAGPLSLHAALPTWGRPAGRALARPVAAAADATSVTASAAARAVVPGVRRGGGNAGERLHGETVHRHPLDAPLDGPLDRDRKSTRLNSSHVKIPYAV